MATDHSPHTDSATPSRRTFLTGAALTGVAVGAGRWAGGSATAAPLPAAPRATQPTATCGLELNGAVAGGMQSVSGGAAVGKVFVTKSKKGRHKHIGDISFEDFSITAGTGMSNAFYRIVAETVAGLPRFLTARITTRDGSGAVIAAHHLHTLFDEVEFPALDSNDMDAALMTVKLSQQGVIPGAKAGPVQPTPTTELWRRNNFRLRIDNVDCSHVSHIAGLSCRVPIHPQSPDNPTEPLAGPVEYSNLVITMPASRASSLQKWSQAFVINHKNDKRSGQLDFLSDTAKVLFTLKLDGLGVFKIEPSIVSASSDDVPFVTASIFFDRMTLTHSSAAAG